MSGGEYNYAYLKIADFARELRVLSKRDGNESAATPKKREKFRKLLECVAEAARAIEWNDSGDGCSEEEELIDKCLDFSNQKDSK